MHADISPTTMHLSTSAICMAEGVMDLSDKQTLGLQAISSDNLLLSQAKEGSSFAHHSGLAVFKNHLYCSWSQGASAEDRPGQRVVYRRSADGIHWEEPRILAQPKGMDRYVAAGFLANDDELIAYFTVARDFPIHNLRHPDNALFAMTSRDGTQWSEPQKVINGFFIEAPRRLKSGRLIIGGEHTGSFDEHLIRMQMLYTDDPRGLVDWKKGDIHPENSQPKGLRIFDYTEPCPFERKDGTIVVPFRNYSGHLYTSISTDQGETWSTPVETNFPDCMSRCHTGILPDGTTYIINNPGPDLRNRDILTISLSNDGITFDRARRIQGGSDTMHFQGEDKVKGLQYPSGIAWNDHLYVSTTPNKEDVLLFRIPLKALEKMN